MSCVAGEIKKDDPEYPGVCLGKVTKSKVKKRRR